MMTDAFAHLDTANKKENWLILGPEGGGCVHNLTVNPHRPDTLVVSCDMTAGYITHNGGETSRMFNLKSRQHAYAIDPHDADTLWVGASGLFRSRDHGATWNLVFGKGYGKQALAAMDERLQSMNVESVGLHVFGDNVRAQELYKKMGFEVAGLHMLKKYR